MLHNHSSCSDGDLARGKMADTTIQPDRMAGSTACSKPYMRDVYREFFAKALSLKILKTG